MRFAVEPRLGGTLGVVRGDAVFHVAQRVEHLNDGRAFASLRPRVAELLRHEAGEPVVAVDDIVARALAGGKIEHALDKLIEVGFDLGDGQRPLRPGGDVDHAAPLADFVLDEGLAVVL